MKIGQYDLGNKVQGIKIKDLETCFGGVIEAGDVIRIYNKEGCAIATFKAVKQR